MEKKMFYNAGTTIFHHARELRSQPTDAERILWMHLTMRPKGYKFRRQHPVANYVLDFYCHALKLAIEVDGSIHNKMEIIQSDSERQEYLEEAGIQFLRFTNEEILLHSEAVIERIKSFIDGYLNKSKTIV